MIYPYWDAAAEIADIVKKHKGSEKIFLNIWTLITYLKSIGLIMLEFHFSYDQPIVEPLKKNSFVLFKQNQQPWRPTISVWFAPKGLNPMKTFGVTTRSHVKNK